MTGRVLYTCPKCSHQIFARHIRRGHPQLPAIEADIAKGIHITVVKSRYNLKRNQYAGIFARYWAKVNNRSQAQ